MRPGRTSRRASSDQAHVHAGPGIRRLLNGELTIESPEGTHTYRAGGAWIEGADFPVLATASATDDTAFVRVLLLPAEWAGKRTIRYVDPADDEKPKLQRATILLEQPIAAMRTGGGRVLVDQLERHGVDLVFCLPGESYLPVLDALHDSPIRLVSCRHEQGAANMAEAYGKLTGRPGCLPRHARPRRDAGGRSASTRRCRTRRR